MSPTSTSTPPIRRRPGLLTLAAGCMFVIAVVVGGVSGFLVSFGACFKQTCSDAEANAWAIGLFGGMFAGAGAIALLVSQRDWLYQHAGLLWITPAIVGAVACFIIVAGTLPR